MNDEKAYRAYLTRIYSMPEGSESGWNVEDVPARFIDQRRQAELFHLFVEKCRAAFAEAVRLARTERRWPK